MSHMNMLVNFWVCGFFDSLFTLLMLLLIPLPWDTVLSWKSVFWCCGEPASIPGPGSGFDKVLCVWKECCPLLLGWSSGSSGPSVSVALFVLFSGDFAVPHGFCSLGNVQEEQVWAGPRGWGGCYLMEEEGLDEGAAWIAVGQGHRVV